MILKGVLFHLSNKAPSTLAGGTWHKCRIRLSHNEMLEDPAGCSEIHRSFCDPWSGNFRNSMLNTGHL